MKNSIKDQILQNLQSSQQVCPTWKVKTVKNIDHFSNKPNIIEKRFMVLEESTWNLLNSRNMSEKDFIFSLQGNNSGLSSQQFAALYDGDEAYAGAKDFYKLQDSVHKFLGYEKIIPTHNGIGASHIFNIIAVEKQNSKVLANQNGFPSTFTKFHMENRILNKQKMIKQFASFEIVGLQVKNQEDEEKMFPFYGNIDLPKLAKQIQEIKPENISYIFMVTNVEGEIGSEMAFSLENLQKVQDIAKQYSIPIVLEATNIIGNALIIQEYEEKFKNFSIQQIIKEITKLTDCCIFSTEDEFLSDIGGVIAFNETKLMKEKQWYIGCQSQLVSFEGLHTYGGLSGRDMGVIAIGIAEAVHDSHVKQRSYQTRYLTEKLQEKGIPIFKFSVSTQSIYIDCTKFMNQQDGQDKILPNHSFGIALALSSGILVRPVDTFKDKFFIKLQIPARKYSMNQIEYIANSVIKVYENKNSLPIITQIPRNQDVVVELPETVRYYFVQNDHELLQLALNCSNDELNMENWVVAAVEHTSQKSQEERQKALEEAGFNTFLLKMDDGVLLDLLTDSGTNAMSTDQWASMNNTNDFGGDSFNFLVKTISETYGFQFVIPTHQGRMAEFIISQSLINTSNDVIPGNMYFTTTKFHQQYAGATFVDVIIDEAHDSQNLHPFKGNICLNKLENLIKSQIQKYNSPNIPYIAFAGPVNMAGGQPFSMKNLQDVKLLCEKYNKLYPNNIIRMVFDATRAVENCEMIREQEKGYQNYSLPFLLKEICSYFDAATMSGKKDNLINIGGFLAIRDETLFKKCQIYSVSFDGDQGTSGIQPRNMMPFALGIKEMLNENYIYHRLLQVRKFGKLLQNQGVPIVQPIGGHGIFIDANQFLKDENDKEIIPKEQYKAQSLAAAIFKVSGIRSMERGAVSAGRDSQGKEIFPKLELVRLCIPRRVYLDEHLEYAAIAIGQLYRQRQSIKGLKLVYEPPHLRFFQAKFCQI